MSIRENLLGFRPRFVGDIDVWKDLCLWIGTLPLPLVALALRTFLYLISDQPVSLGFHHRVEQYRPAVNPSSSPVVGVVGVWEGFCAEQGTLSSRGDAGSMSISPAN